MNGKYFRFLAEQRQVSLEDCDDSGWTALHWLAFRRDPGRVSLLLDLGTNVNASSQSGFSPLHMIGFPLNFSNFHPMQMFALGIDPWERDEDGNTFLHHLVKQSAVPVVRQWLQEAPKLIEARNHKGQTPSVFCIGVPYDFPSCRAIPGRYDSSGPFGKDSAA